MNKLFNSFWLFFSVAITLVVYTGCGGDLASVSGTVTINDQPYPGVFVTFQPESGERPSTGTTDEEGKYTLSFSRDKKGIIKGPCVVTLEKRSGGGEGAQYLPPEYNAKASENPEMNIVVEKSGTFDFNVVMDPDELKKQLEIEANTPDYNDSI